MLLLFYISRHNSNLILSYINVFSNTDIFSCSGPDGTCFEGGVFPAKLTFPTDYPLSPPKMQFMCEMFHPNSRLILTML